MKLQYAGDCLSISKFKDMERPPITVLTLSERPSGFRAHQACPKFMNKVGAFASAK